MGWLTMTLMGTGALVLFGLFLFALDNSYPPITLPKTPERKYPMTLTHTIISEQYDRIYIWNGAHTVNIHTLDWFDSKAADNRQITYEIGQAFDVFTFGDFADDKATLDEFVASVKSHEAERMGDEDFFRTASDLMFDPAYVRSLHEAMDAEAHIEHVDEYAEGCAECEREQAEYERMNRDD